MEDRGSFPCNYRMIGKIFLVLFLWVVIYNALYYQEPSCVTTNYTIWDTINFETISSFFLSAIVVEGSFSLYEILKRKNGGQVEKPV
jgi:hypothetical protein